MRRIDSAQEKLEQGRALLGLQPTELDEAWLEGFYSQEPIKENPYPRYSSYYKQWETGWWSASQGLDPLFFEYENQLKRAHHQHYKSKRKHALKKRLLQVSGLILAVLATMGLFYSLSD